MLFPKPNFPDKRSTLNPDEVIKIANTSNYVEIVATTQTQLSNKEQFLFNFLTGTDIITLSRDYDLYESQQELTNSKFLDGIEIRTSFSPSQIITLQNIDTEYFGRFDLSILNHEYSLDKTVGVATISIPSNLILQSNKIQLQTLIPTEIYNDTIY